MILMRFPGITEAQTILYQQMANIKFRSQWAIMICKKCIKTKFKDFYVWMQVNQMKHCRIAHCFPHKKFKVINMLQ